MNEQTILDNEGAYSGLAVTPLAQDGLKTAASWSTFLSILGFIFSGLMALASIVLLFAAGSLGDSLFPFPVWILSLFYIGMTVLMFIIYLSLYRFANRTKTALAAGSSGELEVALLNLGKFFKIVGIITVVMLVLYVILLASMGSVMSMFGGGAFGPGS